MSGLDIDLMDYLRLEVETDPTGLVNMVANPSGELGGWGWLTPVAGSRMDGGSSLRYVTGGAANYFTTEPMAVAAGRYVAATWVVPSTVAVAFYRARFEWLDAAGALLSSSTQTGYLAASASAQTLGPIVAPASTAYVRLRFDLYTNNTGTTWTHAGDSVSLNQVTVANAATSGALGTSRKNLITNPSLETNATGWAGTPRGSTVARTTAQAYVGAASLAVTSDNGASDPQAWAVSPSFPVTPGKDYTAQARVRVPNVTDRRVWIHIRWKDAGNSVIGTPTSTVVTVPATTWTQVVTPARTAPAGAVTADIRVGLITNYTAGIVWWLDAALVEQASAAGTYFDGATAAGGGWTYSWDGTAQASTSTAFSSSLGYLDPVPYLNILGSSAALDISRAALDVGTIQATVKDASLDPATDDLIRPGRSVRLRALNNTTGAWDVLAAGTLQKGATTYDLRKPEAKRATITLATTDANQVLANTNRNQGVATIAALPYVLEGARVPWNVNGSGNQVASATVASVNEQASALDQVVLARDSDLGYAWVTKEGVLTAYDDRTLDYYGTGTALVDESVYSGLDVTFDPDDCINEVMVTYRRYISATQEVEEVTFGPYRDAASIDAWGVHQKTFVVHGIGEANVPAYAADILAANATPERRISQVRIPIRDAADLVRTKALVDLYAKVRVVNTDLGLDQTLRVTGIRHQIGPRRWTMVLTFAQVDSVAQPLTTTAQAAADTGQVTAYRMAAGTVALGALAANTGASVAVTFPVGRFSVAPVAQVTGANNGYTAGSTGGTTTTGMTVRAYNPTASTQTAGTIHWQAVQMTPTTAAG